MSKPSLRLLRYRPGIEALSHFYGDRALEAFMLFSLRELEFDSAFLSKIFNKPIDLGNADSPFTALLTITEQVMGTPWQIQEVEGARRPGKSGLPRRIYTITKDDLRLVYLLSYLPNGENGERIMEGSIVVLPVKPG